MKKLPCTATVFVALCGASTSTDDSLRRLAKAPLREVVTIAYECGTGGIAETMPVCALIKEVVDETLKEMEGRK